MVVTPQTSELHDDRPVDHDELGSDASRFTKSPAYPYSLPHWPGVDPCVNTPVLGQARSPRRQPSGSGSPRAGAEPGQAVARHGWTPRPLGTESPYPTGVLDTRDCLTRVANTCVRRNTMWSRAQALRSRCVDGRHHTGTVAADLEHGLRRLKLAACAARPRTAGHRQDPTLDPRGVPAHPGRGRDHRPRRLQHPHPAPPRRVPGHQDPRRVRRAGLLHPAGHVRLPGQPRMDPGRRRTCA